MSWIAHTSETGVLALGNLPLSSVPNQADSETERKCLSLYDSIGIHQMCVLYVEAHSRTVVSRSNCWPQGRADRCSATCMF